MRHYIAIFVEDHMGGVARGFSDAPGCEAKAFSLHDAQYVAATALMQLPINMRRQHYYQWMGRLCTDAKNGWSERGRFAEGCSFDDFIWLRNLTDAARPIDEPPPAFVGRQRRGLTIFAVSFVSITATGALRSCSCIWSCLSRRRTSPNAILLSRSEFTAVECPKAESRQRCRIPNNGAQSSKIFAAWTSRK